MLKITIPPTEMFNEETQEFFYIKGQELILEHSLVSLSKWESEWKKPFLSKEEKTRAETIHYIECMTITQNVDPNIYKSINSTIMDQVNKYIEHPMTATTFAKPKNKPPNREIITAEIIYYWMILFNIPFECQKWHLNRLLTLINVCNLKSNSDKKMTRAELLARNRALNAARRNQLGTTG